MNSMNKKDREEAYLSFLQEKEYGNKLFDSIMNADINQVGAYLLSEDLETRWLAKWRLSQILEKPGKNG